MNRKVIKQLDSPSTIGIIGGGQLGRMLVLEAKRLGLKVIVLDPKENSPAGQIADFQMVAEFDDLTALKLLALKTDVITYEFEHIDVALLGIIEQEGATIYPSAKTLGMIQNKYRQKSRLRNIGIKVPDFYRIENLAELVFIFDRLDQKMVLKTCTGGYDGKGSRVITDRCELEKTLAEFSDYGVMAEELIHYEKEVSIIFAMNHDGIQFYPVTENIHHQGILLNSFVPANISIEMENRIRTIARKIAEEINDYGVFCIEFFIDDSANILVNEIAPRPHNSGHYSIEGCVTSQFEQLARIITGMPLGSTELRLPCAMFNILGSEAATGKYQISGLDSMMGLTDCHLHLYGKPESGELKKIGHITALGDSVAAANSKAEKALSLIKINRLRSA
ncbi:5-(carboxyamino)imidazole ribonucleotide synthase [Acetobacterium malicum]|uniref:N5-carboxyaminoimidazole ribonucleotide synthase n=1 Tax=Acetobacterium malicum TaxID=52692 RepID=A0ABR6YXF0_9FIRM|nr:5-(carboxyamino)imidazole ribonucleotide synthase [Acetobacterium malicum]MBC3899882.1 5-(carboxyamino)imidazole ribonucleotide synthase [Acetobacterium malicum]